MVLGDIAQAMKLLTNYAEKGYPRANHNARSEPEIFSEADPSKIRALTKLSTFGSRFAAVDCSTRILKRANNWGIYLFRPAYATIDSRTVDWGYQEKIRALVGPAYARFQALRNLRLEFESELALDLVKRIQKGDYLLLDGASYFGEHTGYYVTLFEKCRDEGVNLMAMSKQSPTLRDERGRDFQTTAQLMTRQSLWVYHPVAKANPARHLYGDIALVKLCPESPRIFRLDVMAYLISQGISEILSPLTAVSEDPRCLGYPVPLWLAHEFSATADSKLLYYLDKIEEHMKESGHYDRLNKEEQACSFADELHGMQRMIEREVTDYV